MQNLGNKNRKLQKNLKAKLKFWALS